MKYAFVLPDLCGVLKILHMLRNGLEYATITPS